MKKLTALILTVTFILMLTACGGGKSFDVKIVIPADNQEEFVFSNEEISPTSGQITVSSGEGLGDTMVILKEAGQENAEGKGEYLTPGMPVKLDAEKGKWYQVGIASMKSPTGEDITVYVNVEDVEIRIS